MSTSDKATNGSGAAPKAARATAGTAEGTVADDDAAAGAGRDSGDLLVAMSPRQIIGGFAVLAGLIVMLRRRRKDKG